MEYVFLYFWFSILPVVCIEYTFLGNDTNRLTSWPSSDIHDNSTEVVIEYTDKSLLEIPQGEMQRLNYLEAFEMSSYYLTIFPDLCPVGDTLQTLSMTHGYLDNIPPAYMDCLVEVRTITISSNKLTTFPDVTGPGNSLRYLYIQGNLFTQLPDLTNVGKSLVYWNVYGIPAVYPNGTLFDSTVAILKNLTALKGLMIGDASVDEFPDFSMIPELAKKMYQLYPIGTDINIITERYYLLNNLEILGLNNHQDVTTVPNPGRPWPSAGKLYFQDNPLYCDCRVRWMKHLPSDVLTIDATPCVEPPALVGRDWTTIKETEFTCNHSVPGQRIFKFEKLANTHFSFPPIVGRFYLNTELECARLCLATEGCMYVSMTDRDFPDISGIVCDITSFNGTRSQLFESEAYTINDRLNWQAYILYI